MKKKTFPMIYGGVSQKFAQSVVAGDFVFLSGSSGRTPKDGEVSSTNPKEQVKTALSKIKIALEVAGSCMDNIIKVQILVKDIAHYSIIKEAEFEYYREHAPRLFTKPPASTVWQVVSLSKPDMLVEFDIIALRGDLAD